MEFNIGKYKFICEVTKNPEKVEPTVNFEQESFSPISSEIPYQSALEERILQDEIDRIRQSADECAVEDVQDETPEPSEVETLHVQPVLENVVPKIMEECSDLISEFEAYKPRFTTDEGIIMAETIQDRLTELLTKYGAQLIDNDTQFDILRHTAVPAQIVENGTPIQEFIRPGIVMRNKVLVRAQVRV